MLIEFRVENHRSLKTEQVLTMEAGRVDGDATIPRTVPGYSKPLLPVAALYGANASGKSNVLSGLAFMRRAVTGSLREWGTVGRIPIHPFAWGESHLEPSLYEVMFIEGGVRYQYGFVLTAECIQEEWLYAWPKGRKQVWFQREKQNFEFGDKLIGECRKIESLTRPNVLFLSVAVQFPAEQLSVVSDWFLDLIPLNINLLESDTQPFSTDYLLHEALVISAITRDQVGSGIFDSITQNRSGRHINKMLFQSLFNDFRSWLSHADVGIIDIMIEEHEEALSPSGQKRESPEQGAGILFRHSNSDKNAWLSLWQESKGTRQLYDIGLPILLGIRTGGIVFVDELEASLHPKLAIEIIKQFNNPQTNPKNAQLIFTTHDTNLLGNDAGEPVLRRDQVWLTEKDKEGATVLYPLTDFKPRKPENLERGYLQGRYGAIPYLGRFSLASEVSK